MPLLATFSIIGDVSATNFTCEFDTLCGMQQFTGDDKFDWTINTGATQSSGTGPSAGHDGGGYYAYIEVSEPLKQGDMALLITPSIERAVKHTLRFYYHMYGIHINELIVKEYTAYPTSINDGTVAWNRTGQAGDVWKSATVDLKLGTLYVGFLGYKDTVSDYNVKGDIAIDGIDIRDYTRIEDTQFSCTFDDGNFCGMIQETNDQFDWNITNIPTPSANTGPSFDHTPDDIRNYFIYLEVSERLAGASAALSIPNTPVLGQTYAVTAWYHMYGSSIGTLKVLSYDVNGVENILWNRTGQSPVNPDSWYLLNVTLPADAKKVTFKADKGGSNQDVAGDIALDDISLTLLGAATTTSTSSTTSTSTVSPSSTTSGTTTSTTTQSTVSGSTRNMGTTPTVTVVTGATVTARPSGPYAEGYEKGVYLACDKKGARCFSNTGVVMGDRKSVV